MIGVFFKIIVQFRQRHKKISCALIYTQHTQIFFCTPYICSHTNFFFVEFWLLVQILNLIFFFITGLLKHHILLDLIIPIRKRVCVGDTERRKTRKKKIFLKSFFNWYPIYTFTFPLIWLFFHFISSFNREKLFLL